ncbi:ABC transporter substrate-binding protein [Rugamonas sp. CCM 8940]|uniref:ABC transporter substrate-binding protein n=1 Tax=Rugamonas sp. CCM 8940 TaxID=2765359 RepID=UPI0018F40F4F|nr:ABC transporter substrate-binding protein [Rugamonas sp. CCM 8940]MBJ7310524.1 ABC transporter substrate-binding protein [Rugamonas sp. CCM 8940]
MSVLVAWAVSGAAAAGEPELGRPAATPAPIAVNIGYPRANYWPLYVARDLKLFEQVGLEPRFSAFTTGAPLMEGMKNGSLDVAWTGLATLFMLGKDIPLRFILVAIDTSSQMSMVVDPRAGIHGVADLKKSKAIGAPGGTCGEVSAVLAAKKARLPVGALKVSNLAPNLLLGALRNGQIDTAFIWGPWDLQLRDAGFKIVASDRDFVAGGGVCASTVAMRPAFLERHPSVGCKMVKVHALALAAGRRDPEMAIRAIQKELGLSYKLAKESYETLAVPSIPSQLAAGSAWSLTNEDGGLAEKLRVAAEVMFETKSFSQPLSKETIWRSIDAKHVRQYLQTDCK